MENYYCETNEWGDEWIFEYDFAANKGILVGSDSDIDGFDIPVIEGHPVFDLLNPQEEKWLLSHWTQIAKSGGIPSLYLQRETQFIQGADYCYLTNDYCPLCLMQKKKFHNHHVIWAADGGLDDCVNLLRICATCHAIINWGSEEDRVPRELAALNHQLAYFGFQLYPRHSRPSGRHKGANFLDDPAHGKLISKFDSLGEAEQEIYSNYLRTKSRVKYQYFRDMGLGKYSYDNWVAYHERREQILASIKPGSSASD